MWKKASNRKLKIENRRFVGKQRFLSYHLNSLPFARCLHHYFICMHKMCAPISKMSCIFAVHRVYCCHTQNVLSLEQRQYTFDVHAKKLWTKSYKHFHTFSENRHRTAQTIQFLVEFGSAMFVPIGLISSARTHPFQVRVACWEKRNFLWKQYHPFVSIT